MGRGKQDRRALSTGSQDTGALVQLVFRKSERLLGLVGLFGAGLFESNGPTNVRRCTDGSGNWRATPTITYLSFFWPTLLTANRILALLEGRHLET